MAMTPRQRRFWWVAGIVLALGAGVVVGTYGVLNTARGRRWIAGTLSSKGSAVFGGRGALRIGVLRRIGPGGVEADNVVLVDTAGVPVLTATKLRASIAWMGLLDKRISLPRVELSGVRLMLRQDRAGTPWNIAYLLAGDTTPPVPRTEPAFGDDVRIGALSLADGEVTTVAPWSPHPVFTGAARDSVIAVRDSLHDLTQAPDGTWFERRVITLSQVRAHDLVIIDPLKRPSSLVLDTVAGVISDPPVTLRQAQGRVTWTSDSLMFDLARVALPASVGRARGTVAWNQPGPVRYAATVHAEAGLSDLTWIWDALPPVGRGRAVVRLRTLADANDAEYLLDSLNVESEGSQIAGRVGVTVRPAELLLHSTDLTFTPLTDALARRLSYDALPPEVRGTFRGRFVAEQGGPLAALRVDRLDLRFTDAGVAGGAAESRLSMRGLLGIGAEPRAQGLVVDTVVVDLRTVRALVPDAPAVDGRVAGSARLRSADLSRADAEAFALQWTDAAGNVSTLSGRGVADYGRSPVTVDGLLTFEPLSLAALARLDSTLTLRRPLSGQVAVRGPLDSLMWRAAAVAAPSLPEGWPLFADVERDSTWRAVPGAIVAAGTGGVVDSAWHANARVLLDAFDARAWLERSDVPSTGIGGELRVAARGRIPADTTQPAMLTGRVEAALAQTAAADRPAMSLLASLVADEQRVVVDSASLALGDHLSGLRLEAHGALGRDSTASDTLLYSLRVDSLDVVGGDLQRLAAMVAPVDSALASNIRAVAEDTLRGDASVSGHVAGNLKVADANAAVGGRDLQLGAIHIGRLFGSARAVDVFHKPAFEGAASADDVTGIGAARVQSANFRVAAATLDSGQLVLDVSTVDDAHLVVRGGYVAQSPRTAITLDSIRLSYDSVTWREARPATVVLDSLRVTLSPLELRSNGKGVLAVEADVPRDGTIRGLMRLEDFPAGEVSALLAGTPPANGTVTGEATLGGTRQSPTLTWNVVGAELGMEGTVLPVVTSRGNYANQRLRAEALVRDTLGGALRLEGTFPMDLRLASVEKRLLSDVVDGRLVADSLQLGALALQLDGVRGLRGALSGELALGGTFDSPSARGTMRLTEAQATLDALGITALDGEAVVRAAGDSLVLETLRARSGGPRDTVGVVGSLRFPPKDSALVDVRITASNFVASRQRDGTDLDLSGDVRVRGKLLHPQVSGRLFVPRANLVIDPLGARSALDLSSASARALLGADEVPVAQSAAASLAALGEQITVSDARVELGNDVWVQTPEARVKLSGGLDVMMRGQALALDGEILANRGQYRLDLGVVSRSFTVDSGRVRFFANSDIPPTLDITATNTVRVSGSNDIPVRVHIGGNLEEPVLTLTSSDPLYASAPESEIISLLIFGAPTFALDGQSQSTVRAVTGVLLPSVGGAVEGALQRLLPGGFNTIQVTTAGGQSQGDLNAMTLLDNLSISAGKQLGERTFLRINTGLCRGAGQATTRGASPWIGVAAEYRITRTLMGQVGVDPGAAPCSQLGGAVLPRMQFGFDLFREWIW
jgi:translocation and assembly module TamB